MCCVFVHILSHVATAAQRGAPPPRLNRPTEAITMVCYVMVQMQSDHDWGLFRGFHSSRASEGRLVAGK